MACIVPVHQRRCKEFHLLATHRHTSACVRQQGVRGIHVGKRGKCHHAAVALPEAAAVQSTGRPKVSLVALGCPKNLVDGEVMLGDLQRAGFEVHAPAAWAETLLLLAALRRNI